MKLKDIAIFGVLLFTAFTNANALVIGDVYSDTAGNSWEYVGSWEINDGPSWGLSPGVDVMYNGLEAAEFIFGSVLPGWTYATASNDSGIVDHMAWYDGWGVHDGVVLAEGYNVDRDGDGFYESDCVGGYQVSCSDMSAYITDGYNNTNYAFIGLSNNSVPEPSAIALMGLGLLGFVATRRKIQK